MCAVAEIQYRSSSSGGAVIKWGGRALCVQLCDSSGVKAVLQSGRVNIQGSVEHTRCSARMVWISEDIDGLLAAAGPVNLLQY